MEPLRWKELSAFEALAIRRIQDLGMRDETLTRIDASQSGTLPEEIRRIFVAGTPDLHPLSIAALETAQCRLPVEIFIHAPEDQRNRFDEWGRPLPEQWLETEIEIPGASDSIHDAVAPTDQAERACDLIGVRLSDSNNPGALRRHRGARPGKRSPRSSKRHYAEGGPPMIPPGNRFRDTASITSSTRPRPWSRRAPSRLPFVFSAARISLPP